MAIEIFLSIDGISGESQKSGAEGWIEIFSFSNGASNPSSVAFGTGSGAGKVDLSSISLQKQLDMSSPYLFANCCAGTHAQHRVHDCPRSHRQRPPRKFTSSTI